MKTSIFVRPLIYFILHYGVFFVLFISLAGMDSLLAQEMPIPIKVQVPLFTKILSFDRNLKTRVGNEIVLGIVYQKNFRTSFDVQDQIITTITEIPIREIDGISLRCIAIEMKENIDLTDIITKNKVDILYITPMRTLDFEKISAISRANQILTISGVPDYIDEGFAVGIGSKGDKPMIIVNLKAAKAEGADFNSQLLKLAKIIQ